MKKYIYLFLSTLLIITVIVLSGYAVNGNTAEVEVFALETKNMDNTITSSGKLQYKSAKSIKADEMGIIKDIFVKNGDEIKKDDVLFSYYQAEGFSQYADLQNLSALLGSLTAKEQILDEVKKYCTVKEVKAESGGKVTGIQYSSDDIVQKGSEVIKLSNTDILEIPVNINENYIRRVKAGQKVEITFNAVEGKKYSGKVTKISDEAVQTTGLSGKETTVAVTVTLDDKKDDKLRIGYSADCMIITSTDENVLVLPYEYIHSDNKGDYVFSAVRNRAKKIYIKTGNEYKDGTQVISGLNKNDKIIKNEVYEGQNIIIKK